MTVAEWGQWVVSGVSLAAWAVLGRKTWWAWHVVLASQAAWIVFGLATGQPAFAVSAGVYCVVGVRNARLWTRDHRAEQRMALAGGSS